MEKVPTPESLVVLFNPVRNEAYVHRQAGKVSVINTKNYKVVKIYDTPVFPNSLVPSADGKILYVSVKHTDNTPDHHFQRQATFAQGDGAGFGKTAGDEFQVQIITQISQRVTQRVIT